MRDSPSVNDTLLRREYQASATFFLEDQLKDANHSHRLNRTMPVPNHPNSDGAQTDATPMDELCNCFSLRRAARTVTRQYAETMRDTGLQATQYSILAMLSAGERLSISELADDLGLERTSMSRTLRPMEREGLVALSSEGFRRKRAIELTAAGFSRYQECLPLWRTAQARFAKKYSPEQLNQLHSLLALIGE